MALPTPTVVFNFANTPDYFDPRLTFQRPSVATFVDHDGLIKKVPANTPRWAFNRLTGECEGIIVEPTRTNRFVRSADFGTTWSQNGCSVTTNTVLSPQGTVTADTLTTTSTTSFLSQTVTVTSGNTIAFSVFVKPNTSNFVRLRAADAGSIVQAWYNLATGAVGTNTAGSTTCAFFSSRIEQYLDGWYRCALAVTTTVNTGYTFSITPVNSDGGTPTSTESVYIWGAQAESENATTSNAITSYISTTAATVTRNSDNIILPVSQATDKWFNVREGAITFEMTMLDEPAGIVVYGGMGDVFGNNVYVWRTAASTIGFSIGSTAGGSSLHTRQTNLKDGARNKLGVTWSSTTFHSTINGATPSSTAVTLAVPVSTVRFGIGTTPYAASATTSLAHANIRSFTYYPKKIDATDLMTITA